jgi:ABC-type glycerol-3-phosphate transport system permease component
LSRRPPARIVASERLALVVIVGVFLFPVVWLITTAYKPGRDIFSFPPTLAFKPTLANFRACSATSIFHLIESSPHHGRIRAVSLLWYSRRLRPGARATAARSPSPISSWPSLAAGHTLIPF